MKNLRIIRLRFNGESDVDTVNMNALLEQFSSERAFMEVNSIESDKIAVNIEIEEGAITVEMQEMLQTLDKYIVMTTLT